MTPAERDKAVGVFADQIVKLATVHPASGVLRELVKNELREFLEQFDGAEGAKEPNERA